MPIDATLRLAEKLIVCRSVTPDDGSSQSIIGERLQHPGFKRELIHRGGVTNLWRRRGAIAPLFCFAGHTDVVPCGPALTPLSVMYRRIMEQLLPKHV